ncbi:Aste57867_14474 [Aphanomyces stellatus]|uniref:Aste57867_14474 protein n=1 Tax=Aphanomyces stellatus TaxID=120398 RepID=A0A485L0T6_9STRA|nr:hypothetical protein As57867_014420 [Aphanomyces stellatus]VFT91296.1 Aste57867_14474 [Aphanomyces stellatus]
MAFFAEAAKGERSGLEVSLVVLGQGAAFVVVADGGPESRQGATVEVIFLFACTTLLIVAGQGTAVQLNKIAQCATGFLRCRLVDAQSAAVKLNKVLRCKFATCLAGNFGV